MTDIAFASAKKLAGLVRRKKIGCAELLVHFLQRVEKYNPTLNAIIATNIQAAKKRARAADRALAKGDLWGPFHGVPMTVKEAFDVDGLPTTWGVPEFRDDIAKTNALAVNRFIGAGATVFGKTNVPTWLANSQTFNAIYGLTRNPWNLDRTPGGSSGGSAVAVCAGLSGIEIGSDIASSIRNPAIYCGIYGHKPTYGICPPRGHAAKGRISPDDINVIGPLARTADDLQAALEVIAGPDEIDSVGYRLALPAPRRKALKDFKIAVMPTDLTSDVDNVVQAAVTKVADFLAKKKARVSDKARPVVDMDRAHKLFNYMLRAATSHRQTDAVFANNLAAVNALHSSDDTHATRMQRGAVISHRDWLELNEERHKMRWAWHEFFKEYDLMLAPLTVAPAHLHETEAPLFQRTCDINGKTVPFAQTLFWAGFVGLAYLPATAIPIGFSEDGLPLGLQVIGPQYGDLTCIHFAKLMEAEFFSFSPPPGFE